MIKLHRLDGSEFVRNADHIETIEATPIARVRLTNGKVYVVKEPIDQVLTRCVSFKRALYEGVLGRQMGVLPSHWTRADSDPSDEAPGSGPQP